MTDPVSFPKLPVNLSQVLTEDPTLLRRSLREKKGTPGPSANDSELVETCRQMESIFIHHLFKEMRATIQRSGFISGGRAEEIYTSMMDAEMAAKLSERGGIGLADILLHQLGKPASDPATEDTGDAE